MPCIVSESSADGADAADADGVSRTADAAVLVIETAVVLPVGAATDLVSAEFGRATTYDSYPIANSRLGVAAAGDTGTLAAGVALPVALPVAVTTDLL
jgi:hypothetical protein